MCKIEGSDQVALVVIMIIILDRAHKAEQGARVTLEGICMSRRS